MAGLFGGGSKVSQAAPVVASFRVQTSAYGRPIPFGFGRNRSSANLLWYDDFTAIPHSSPSESGGKGGDAPAQSNTTFTYTAAVLLLIGKGVIDGVGGVWRDKERTTLGALGLTLFTGTDSQIPFSHLSANHPDKALAYRSLAYVAHAALDLGESATVGNHNFEVNWPHQRGTTGQTGKTFTLDAATHELVSTAHGFAELADVRLATSGALPLPLAAGIDYFARDVTADRFRLSTRAGGDALLLKFAMAAESYWTTKAALAPGDDVYQIVDGGEGSFVYQVFHVYPNMACAGHPFVADTKVRLLTTGGLPAPLATGTDYYVRQPTAGTIALSATPGGAVIDLTTVGTGTHEAYAVGTGTHTATRFVPDADVTEVISAIALVAGIQPAQIGSLAQVSDYCVANGIFVSPVYTEQREAREALDGLLQIANAEVVFSEDQIKLVPYSDEAATGNGATYTPASTPIFELTEDDFLDNGDAGPVEYIDEDASDAYNVVKLKFQNREKDYADDVVEAQDDDHIAIYGRRPMPEPLDYPEIVDPEVARIVVNIELRKRIYERMGYRLRLGPGKVDVLEPMDPVALTYAPLGMSALPVRIREMDEEGEGEKEAWTLTVREFQPGVAAPVLYPVSPPGGYVPNVNLAPGSVNVPVIFDAPAVLTDSGFELCIAASGRGAAWGGCEVWVATDAGGPFKKVGAIAGGARHGVLVDALPIGADPDTVNVASVDLTAARGSLTGGTQADADNFSTLCWIEGELLSYQTATLTGLYQYDLEDYLRRGVFNTLIAERAAGVRFVRLDQAVFRYPYDSSLVGSTLYVKLPSFNAFGFGRETLDAVPAYAYEIAGPIGAPDAPTGFTVQQTGNLLNFTVDAVATLGLDRVEIRYADPGETMWANGVPVTNILRGHTDSNGSVPPGAWRFMARSYDRAGQPSKTWAVYDLTVSAGSFQAIASQQDAPAWNGTISNFVVTWSGALVPKSQYPGDHYAGNEWIDEWVPDPYPICTYEAAEIDKAIDASARVWGDIVSVLGPGVTAGTASPRHQIDYRREADAYDGFEDWVNGVVDFRRLKSRLVVDTSVGLVKVTGFATVIDKEPFTEEKQGLTIGPTGTAIVFDNAFHLAPIISPFSDDATPKIATHTGDSATGFTEHLFSTAGAEVGGTGGYRARGV